MSRTFVQAVLEQDAASSAVGSLGNLGVLPGAIMAAEAADDPKLLPRAPFVTHRWGNVSRGVGGSVRQFVDIWVHDRNRDYVRIDAILLRVRKLFESVEAQHATEGWITQIDWQGSSPDLRDDGYDTVTRNGTFLVVASTR